MAKILLGYTRCKYTRAAFEKHGHDVWTCDLLPCAHEKHFQCDIWEVAEAENWSFGLFHPMCTYMNVAAAWAYKDPDFNKYPGVGYHQKVRPGTLTGQKRREKQAEEVENFKRLDRLPYPHAIENPSPSFLSRLHRKPDQTIQPNRFGDDASKGTGLWLYKVPKLAETKIIKGRMVLYKGKMVERWANQTDSGQNKLPPNSNRWLERSATYPGIAAAMGDQWGRLF